MLPTDPNFPIRRPYPCPSRSRPPISLTPWMRSLPGSRMNETTPEPYLPSVAALAPTEAVPPSPIESPRRILHQDKPSGMLAHTSQQHHAQNSPSMGMLPPQPHTVCFFFFFSVLILALTHNSSLQPHSGLMSNRCIFPLIAFIPTMRHPDWIP